MSGGDLTSLEVRRVPVAEIATLQSDFVIDHNALDVSRRVDYLQVRHREESLGLLRMEWSASGNVWLWGPQTSGSEWDADEISHLLLTAANDHIDRRGCPLAQVLLDSTQQTEARWYATCGYDRVISLEFLVHMMAPNTISMPSDSHLSQPSCKMVDYTADNHDAFLKTLLASYEESPDCAPLGECGDPGNALADYRSVDGSEPDLWHLLQVANRDVGCLLLRHQVEVASLEIVYLGLIPGFRGRGLGRTAIFKAMHEAKRLGCRRLTVAVDLNHVAARKLYYDLGFVSFSEKKVLIRSV